MRGFCTIGTPARGNGLIEERYGQRPILITPNLEYDDWAEFLGQKAMVSALLDRLRHRCHTIRIEGPSLRTPNP
jgi:DNA replication protein DnaC